MENINSITRRYFGPGHPNPCYRPTVITCALIECQKAGFCQSNKEGFPPLSTGTVITLGGTIYHPEGQTDE